MTVSWAFPESKVSIPCSTNTNSSLERRAPVSQSQGLKEKASPPPSLRRALHTHTWTTRTLKGVQEKAFSQTCTRQAYFFFTHFAVLSALPVFIYDDPSTDTISFSLNYISQLPILLSRNCFLLSLRFCFSLSPSAGF